MIILSVKEPNSAKTMCLEHNSHVFVKN